VLFFSPFLFFGDILKVSSTSFALGFAMNLVEIIGMLVADPEQRFTPSGQKITTLRLADNQKRGKEEVTIWWRVVIWGDTFDRLMPYLKKGTPLIVHGEMNEPRPYQDKEGNTRISLEVRAQVIRFVPFGGNREKQGEAEGAAPARAAAPRPALASQEENDFGDIEFITPASRPGGFMPGRGQGNQFSAEMSDDQLPF
jgi:single-strand DNA-binding protein